MHIYSKKKKKNRIKIYKYSMYRVKREVAAYKPGHCLYENVQKAHNVIWYQVGFKSDDRLHNYQQISSPCSSPAVAKTSEVKKEGRQSSVLIKVVN